MNKTKLSISGSNFYINGSPTYTEIKNSNPTAHGLLMNARFIQGIFDDQADRSRFNRFGRTFDPETNTDNLIKALPEWYSYGLRAFTVGFQGGGPCFTTDNKTIDNNPFGSKGDNLDPEYASRMDHLIRAADELGMVVIVSFFYGGQTWRLKDGKAVVNAVRTASRFLRDNGYTNVIIELANEHDLNLYDEHPIIRTEEGMSLLMDIAREESGGIPVGVSRAVNISREICENSDVVLIHGNGCSRQEYYNRIRTARKYAPEKPILCNEDSQTIGKLAVAFGTGTSWGYYNNMTKQEPPTDWSITAGEDKFFAYRLAKEIGIEVPEIPEDEQYYIQGLNQSDNYIGQKRWIRLASLYPERINYVEFYRNNKLEYTSYNEPFSINYIWNWKQESVEVYPDEEWKALVQLDNGEVVEKSRLS